MTAAILQGKMMKMPNPPKLRALSSTPKSSTSDDEEPASSSLVWVGTTTLFSREVVNLLDMMCHIADENAQAVKEQSWSRQRQAGVTPALLEKQEWNAFRAKLARRKRFITGTAKAGEENPDVDVDEDDIDMLIALVGVLDAQHGRNPLTIAEIVRALQREKVLSVEFSSTARAQAKRLLAKLREMNRAWQDPQGRWALL